MSDEKKLVKKAKRPRLDDISVEWINYKLYCSLQKQSCTADQVKKLIKTGADVNCKDHEGKTLLHHIARIPNCNIEAIKIILESGAKVNARDVNNNTPLHIAAEHSDCYFNFIHELIQNGSEVNSRNNEGNTPLHIAAGSQCTWNIVKQLVDAGAKVNARNYEGNTPLHCAIKYLRSNTASELLSSGADVNIRNGDGSMPLHLALRLLPQGYIVGEILNAGALVNDRDGDGYSPLHMAVTNSFSAADTLIKLGATVCALDSFGKTPRRYIAQSSHFGGILDSLELNVSENIEMNDLSLHFAMKNVYCDMYAATVLSSTIEVNAQDIDGMTPLHHAAKNVWCDENIFLMLVKRGCSIHAVDFEGNFPLHYALQRAVINLNIVKILLENGAKVGLRNRFGDNVLQCALKNNSIDRGRLLICFKMLVKFAILQNEFLSTKFWTELSFQLPELFSYKTECLEERKRLKKIVVHDSLSMFDFVVGKNEDLKRQVEQVFQVLLTHSLPIYIDVILLKVEKKYLVEKLLTQEVYAAYKLPFKSNRIVLKSDCVLHLARSLTKLDLLKYYSAFLHQD